MPSDDHHESRRETPVWLVLAFSALVIAVGIWLFATNTADPDDPPVEPIVEQEPGIGR